MTLGPRWAPAAGRFLVIPMHQFSAMSCSRKCGARPEITCTSFDCLPLILASIGPSALRWIMSREGTLELELNFTQLYYASLVMSFSASCAAGQTTVAAVPVMSMQQLCPHDTAAHMHPASCACPCATLVTIQTT